MTKIKALIFSAIMICLCFSCVDEEEYSDSPRGNFEALWRIIDSRYCFFDYKQNAYGLDWNEVYSRYSRRIDDNMSDSQLFEVLGDMLGELKDGHVVSMFPEGHISEDENKRMGSFKSGMVLMAMQGKSPIIPIYIKPKEHFYSRVVMAIGEPVDVCSILGNRPSLSAIDGGSAIIKEKEEKLKELV